MTAAVLLVLVIVSGVAATARLRSRQPPRLRTDPAPPQHAQRRSRRDVDGYVPVRAAVRLDPADDCTADRLAQALDISDPDPR